MAAYVLPEKNQISPFNLLMGTISSQLTRESIRKIKVQLRGHVNKELLSKLKGGFDVIHILQDRGLVTEKKLSFLRKLLQDCELFALSELLDEYKQAVQVMNGKAKEGNYQITLINISLFVDSRTNCGVNHFACKHKITWWSSVKARESKRL